MKTLAIKMETVRVLQYSSRDESLSIEIVWNDGQERKNSQLVKIRDSRLSAEEVILKVAKAEKGFNPGVLIAVDHEDFVKKKLSQFFQELLAKTLRVKNTRLAEGYLNLVRDVMRTRVVFE